MRIRTLVLLLLAVILAGGTAYLARLYLAQNRQAEQQAAPKTTPARSVLVAGADIRRGQILRPENMVWQVWPEGSVDKSYVLQGGPQKPESFAGWVARAPISSGEPITPARIIAPGDRGFLAAVLRPGMRAISVPVTLISGISGFIFPGDRVDLLLTYTLPTQAPAAEDKARVSTYEHKVTETVLRDVRVVAIDQRLESKAGEAVPAHTATFEVTPKDGEVIALASEIGKVSLTLRSLVASPSGPPDAEEKIAAVATPPAADASAEAAAQATGSDSSVNANATYTLDSDISPLLPRVQGSNGASENAVVTILRGSTKSSEAAGLSKVSPPSAK